MSSNSDTMRSLLAAADLRQGQEGPTEPELCYRPIALGAAGALLPEWFHEELKFVESQVGVVGTVLSLCALARLAVLQPGPASRWVMGAGQGCSGAPMLDQAADAHAVLPGPLALQRNNFFIQMMDALARK